MSLGRKIAFAFATGLFLIGLGIFSYDVWFICHFGFDGNEVAGVIDEEPIDWPTGERPAWANLPLYAYSFPFLLAAVAMLFFRPRPRYHGRVRFGCE